MFRGIPYAKPPIGRLRWRSPEPVEPWVGVRDATQFGPISPQAPTQIEALLGGSFGDQSEDCLYLNVWTPGCDDSRRPVMVWIHGGAFVIGSASQGLYNGRRLAERDCVIVTLNYRLGVFGFLNLADATNGACSATGAEGIADQILALQWVKRNIATFGGDADNITVFGESAGAMSIAMLMGSRGPSGLFHKAIVQSGSAHIGHSRERSERVARAFFDQLGIAPNEVSKIADASDDVLIQAQIELLSGHHKLGDVPFQPTIDGVVVPERPIDAIRRGAAAGIPVIAGTTKEEWKLFSAASPRLRLMSRGTFEQRIQKIADGHAEAMLAAYADGTTFDRFNAMMTDKVFAVPTARLLEAQGFYAPTFAYRFDWCARFLGGLMGSCHALDLGFVFGTYDAKLASAFFGNGRAADQLSEAMIDAWTAFARSGDPAGKNTGAWPCYDAGSRCVMIFGDGSPHLVEAPNEQRRLAWDALPEHRLGLS